jgi:hypothetical protein
MKEVGDLNGAQRLNGLNALNIKLNGAKQDA